MKLSKSLQSRVLASFAPAALAAGMLMFTAPAAIAAPKSAAPPEAQNSSAWITRQVHHKLAMLPWYGVFDDLAYTVDGDQVTLMGAVVLPATKQDAEASVKSIPGVTQVIDNVEVLPLSSFDWQIRRAEYRAIFSEAQLSRYSMGVNPQIHIIVNNGHVTLEGYVNREADRNVATIRANSVPGVFSVINNLRVD